MRALHDLHPSGNGACPCGSAGRGVVEETTALRCRGRGLLGSQGAFVAVLAVGTYPATMLQRDSNGQTPLYEVFKYGTAAEAMLAICEAGGREVVSAVVHPTHDTNRTNGWLPLHNLIISEQGHYLRQESLLSPWADAFRLLLRLYPEAAGVGTDTAMTPARRAHII